MTPPRRTITSSSHSKGRALSQTSDQPSGVRFLLGTHLGLAVDETPARELIETFGIQVEGSTDLPDIHAEGMPPERYTGDTVGHEMIDP